MSPAAALRLLKMPWSMCHFIALSLIRTASCPSARLLIMGLKPNSDACQPQFQCLSPAYSDEVPGLLDATHLTRCRAWFAWSLGGHEEH